MIDPVMAVHSIQESTKSKLSLTTFGHFKVYALALIAHQTKCGGAPDLLVVKVSASFDPWCSKKMRKDENRKNQRISINIEQNP